MAHTPHQRFWASLAVWLAVAILLSAIQVCYGFCHPLTQTRATTADHLRMPTRKHMSSSCLGANTQQPQHGRRQQTLSSMIQSRISFPTPSTMSMSCRARMPILLRASSDDIDDNKGNEDKTTKIRSWTIPNGVEFGSLSNLVLQETSTPVPKAALPTSTPMAHVATGAVGLNFADIFTVLGLYTAANIDREKSGSQNDNALPPFVPGIEFSGMLLNEPEEDPSSSNSVSYKRKDRVFGFTKFGSYSDRVDVPASTIRKLPSHWTYEQGSAFLVNALTAWYGLVNVCTMPNMMAASGRQSKQNKEPLVVVVHSASGGVGLFAAEIAARRGAVVIGVVGSSSKIPIFMERIQPLCKDAICFVRSPNANQFTKDLINASLQAHGISKDDSTSTTKFSTPIDVAEQGYGVDVVMECYGGPYFQPSLEIINTGGSLATYGSTTYNGQGVGDKIPFYQLVWKYLNRPRIDPGELTSRNVRVGGYNLIFLTEDPTALSKAFDDCIDCLSDYDDDKKKSKDLLSSDELLEYVRPPSVGTTFQFDDGGVDAMKALRSGTTVGKVVLSNANNPLLLP